MEFVVGSPRLAHRANLAAVSQSESDSELPNFSKKDVTERLAGSGMSWSLGEPTIAATGSVNAPAHMSSAPPLELSSSDEDSSSSDEISDRDAVHQMPDSVLNFHSISMQLLVSN